MSTNSAEQEALGSVKFYPSIGQFKNTVKQVRDYCSFHSLPLPTLSFRGTVKCHGTNSGIMRCGGEITLLARSRIVTPVEDNHGFAAWMHGKSLGGLIADGQTLYGEFCGGNIQKGVALSQLPKMFIAFGLFDGENWLPLPAMTPELNAMGIWSIEQFPTFSLDIDFAHPERSVEALTKITEAVEAECPVGNAFGVKGVGEGVVWRCVSRPTLCFKVKGEKHSESKVKTLVPVDVERLESLNALVSAILTENRMAKIHQEMGGNVENSQIGSFLKACVNDCLKEETDTILASGFEVKDFTKKAPSVARDWLFRVQR